MADVKVSMELEVKNTAKSQKRGESEKKQADKTRDIMIKEFKLVKECNDAKESKQVNV